MNLREIIKIIFVVTLFIQTASCSCIGDGAMKVKGAVVDAHGTPINNCILELHFAEDMSVFDSRKISSDFEVTFVIDPRPHDYYMVITCPDISAGFKTDIYRISGSKYFRKPLDLGKIVPKP